MQSFLAKNDIKWVIMFFVTIYNKFGSETNDNSFDSSVMPNNEPNEMNLSNRLELAWAI